MFDAIDNLQNQGMLLADFQMIKHYFGIIFFIFETQHQMVNASEV